MKRQQIKETHDDQAGSVAKTARLENTRQSLRVNNIHSNTYRLPVDSNKHSLPFPNLNFRKPVEIGSFSQDATRTFHHDRRQLRFFVKPVAADPGFDLRQGYASLIRKDENVKEFLDDLLRWVMRNRVKFTLQAGKECKPNAPIDSLHTDFVCWRGLLTRLLCTPYEQRDDWKIAITKFRETFFLCEFETENKKQQQEQITPEQDEMSYWGWKFEQYVTAAEMFAMADTEAGKPDTQAPVNTNEGFCSVVRTRLHSHSLVYGGEVDAWDSSLTGDSKYIELKTSRILQFPRQRHNFIRFKLLKWWAQSYLLGVRKIVSGFRDDQGVVHSLQDFLTQEIPILTQNLHNGWHPKVCFHFLDQLLSFIKRTVSVDDARHVHIMQWRPGQDVQLYSVGTDSDFTFLPPWFVQWEGWGAHTATTTAAVTVATISASSTVTTSITASRSTTSIIAISSTATSSVTSSTPSSVSTSTITNSSTPSSVATNTITSSSTPSSVTTSTITTSSTAVTTGTSTTPGYHHEQQCAETV